MFGLGGLPYKNWTTHAVEFENHLLVAQQIWYCSALYQRCNFPVRKKDSIKRLQLIRTIINWTKTAHNTHAYTRIRVHVVLLWLRV